MPFQLFKKLFKSHRLGDSESEHRDQASKNEKQVSNRKIRFSNLSSAFHRPSRSHVQDTLVIESRLGDLNPLPNVPHVSGTLRRDLVRFKPLPEIINAASDSPESTRPQVFGQVIRRKPVATVPPIIPPRTSSKSPDCHSVDASPQTTPVPDHEKLLPSGKSIAFCAPDSQKQPKLRPQASRTVSPFFHSYTPDAAARRRIVSPTCPVPAPVDPPSSSPGISFSDFPLPPGYESFDAMIRHATTSLSVARAAFYDAPTAIDAQQRLLDYSEACSGKCTHGTCTTESHHRRSSSGNTAPTVYTAQQEQEALPDVQEARDELNRPVDKTRQREQNSQYMIRDGRRSCDMVRRLKDENCQLTAENKTLMKEQDSSEMERQSLRKLLENMTTSLDAVNTQRRLDEVEMKSLKEASLVNAEKVNTTQRELSRVKADLHDERVNCARLRSENMTREKAEAFLLGRMSNCSEQVSLAIQAAENSKAAAKRSDDRNKQLDCAIAAKKYRIDQAAIVLEKNQSFLIKTGHTAEQWYDCSMELTQMLNALGEEHEKLQADSEQKLVKIGTLAELLEGGASELKKAQREAWTERHLKEEESRALAMSQKLHKESEELRRESGLVFAELKNELEACQQLVEIEKKISATLLGDALLKYSRMEKENKFLQDQLSETPIQESTLLGRVNELSRELLQAKQEIANQSRLAQTQVEDLVRTETEAAMLENLRKELDCEVGRRALDLLELKNERDELKHELADVREDLRMTEDNRDLWQKMAENNLTELSLNEQCDQRDWALAQMREQLDLVDELKERNADMQKWGDDLQYELGVHEHRLKEDRVMEIQYFRRFFCKMEEIFNEHQEALVKLESLEDRFAAQLEAEPLKLLREPDALWSFEEEMGPDFVAQTVALYRGRDEDTESSTRQYERVQGVHGFGPAGAPVKSRPEIPEGCLERKGHWEAHEEAAEADGGNVSEE